AELLAERLAALDAGPAAPVLASPARRRRAAWLLLCSDYAFDYLRRHPADLAHVLDDDAVAPQPGTDGFEDALRRYRHCRALAIAERDIAGTDALETTLAATSALAEDCLERALRHAELGLEARHGALLDRAGRPMRLVVFGLGK